MVAAYARLSEIVLFARKYRSCCALFHASHRPTHRPPVPACGGAWLCDLHPPRNKRQYDHHLHRFRSLYVVERDRERIRLVATRERDVYSEERERGYVCVCGMRACAMAACACARGVCWASGRAHKRVACTHVRERPVCRARRVCVCRRWRRQRVAAVRGELGGLEMNFHQASVSFFCHLLLRSATLAFLLR